MRKDIIFIHILKTGGTTINTAMNESYWQTKPDFNYRHIEVGNKKSNAGDIFEPKMTNFYQDYKIFMMLRHPVDRLISEYHFIKDRKEFMSLLRTSPKNFEEYILTRQTQNAVVNFLKGKRMFDLSAAKKSDVEDIINAIDYIPINVGIFEQFEKSLQYFTDTTGIKWKKNVEVKRMNFVRPKVSEISDEIKELIIKSNPYDVELYEYCLKKFNELTARTAPPRIQFIKDKYNHVIPYCHKWCLFTFCLENKKFINQNFNFFKEFNFNLLNEVGIIDGRQFTEVWNRSFLNVIDNHFPNSPFSLALKMSNNENGDPLEQTANIAKAIDNFFDEHKKAANAYYKPMTFDPNMVIMFKQRVGFFSRIFGK